LRRIDGLDCGPVLLADTVGFIRDLPHDLVAAFRSTLAEARDADLLLHVVDASDPDRDLRIRDVEAVLKEIGADDLPQVLVYNKIDLVRTEVATRGDADTGSEPHAAAPTGSAPDMTQHTSVGGVPRARVSAVKGEGIEGLLRAMESALGSQRVSAQLHLPAASGRLRARLHAQGLVACEEADDAGWNIRIDAPRALVEPLFGLPHGDGDWLRERLLAAAGGPTYNLATTPH
jgi:GTP-binding protein HflX